MNAAGHSATRRAATVGLALTLALGWAIMLVTMWGADGHAMDGLHLSFLLMWAAMSVAMMLPTIAPLALAYAERSFNLGVRYVVGYLAVWCAAAPVAYILVTIINGRSWLVGAWFLASLWQAAPWTRAALQRCRMTTSGDDPGRHAEALIAGVRQGLWCAVACLPLMVAGMAAAMTLAPALGIVLMVLLTILMTWEKSSARTLPGPLLTRYLRLSAVVICVLGVGVVGSATVLGQTPLAPPSPHELHHH